MSLVGDGAKLGVKGLGTIREVGDEKAGSGILEVTGYGKFTPPNYCLLAVRWLGYYCFS